MNDPDDGMPPRNPIFFLVIVLAVTEMGSAQAPAFRYGVSASSDRLSC